MSGITKINALTSDAAGIINSSGQSSYSSISKAMNKSNHYFYIQSLSNILSSQDVSKDVMNFVRSNIINSVQELRKSRNSDINCVAVHLFMLLTRDCLTLQYMTQYL